MITRIGIISGEILSLLEDCKTSLSLDQLLRIQDATRDEILMSLGWLAREGFIRMRQVNSNYVLSLNDKKLNKARSKIVDRFLLVNN
jgi:hypothetical protein